MVSNTTLKNKKMKYIIALLFALTFSKIDAQNLQFSQVISQSVAVNESVTVPSGKVWKIEFAAIYGPNVVNASIRVNNSSSIVSCQNCSSVNSFPIWIKAGDVLNFIGADGYISAIEFTVVP
jgi:hypothetical protein